MTSRHLIRLFPASSAVMGMAVILFALAGCLREDRTPQKTAPSAGLAPLTANEEAPELAFLMGELQRLTHKMALSAEAGNAELAGFYMYESLEQLAKIQADAPEYEGQPIALLIDRMSLPVYEPLKAAVAEKPLNKDRLIKGVEMVVQGCNACHAATLHGFIRITPGTETNPFNQSFQP